MKTLLPLWAVLFAVGLTGCQSPPARAPVATTAAPLTRNNCYSLLHQLLDQQKKVGLLRFIKQEEDDVKKLVKRIAANSAVGAQLLEEFARHDPSLNLADLRLPPGETAARAAIAASRKQELLSQTGEEFELTLLLTQTQALSYAAHLAQVAAENEAHPGRARALAGVGEDMEKLYHEVFALLLAKAKMSGVAGTGDGLPSTPNSNAPRRIRRRFARARCARPLRSSALWVAATRYYYPTPHGRNPAR